MGADITIIETAGLPTDQLELIERARDYAAGARADSTRRA